MDLTSILKQKPIFKTHLTDVATALVSLEALYDAFNKDEKTKISFHEFAFRYESKLIARNEEFALHVSAQTIIKNTTNPNYKAKFIDLFNRYLKDVTEFDEYGYIVKSSKWEEKEHEIWLSLMDLKEKLIEYVISYFENNLNGVAHVLEFIYPIVNFNFYVPRDFYKLQYSRHYRLLTRHYLEIAEKIVQYHNEKIFENLDFDKKEIPNFLIIKNNFIVSLRIFNNYLKTLFEYYTKQNFSNNEKTKMFKLWLNKIKTEVPIKEIRGEKYYVITSKILYKHPFFDINSLAKLRDFLIKNFNLPRNIYRTVRINGKSYKAVLIPTYIIDEE